MSASVRPLDTVANPQAGSKSKKFSNDPLFVKRTAYFSEDRRYRYWLDIIWDESKPVCVFIGLNPSTADESRDDNTVRRCRGFAERLGCGGMRMLNLFAFRATDPKVMKAQRVSIGFDNNLVKFVNECSGPIIACWGSHGEYQQQGAWVEKCCSKDFNRPLQCLGKNCDGSPKHPLYLKADTPLEPM